MEERFEHIGEAVERMQERNARVEADKAWETSMFRIGTISAITYISVAAVLYLIGVPNYLFSAVVPVIGYILSTQSLPILKRLWLKNHFEQQARRESLSENSGEQV